MNGDVRAEKTKQLLAAILRETTVAEPVMIVVEDAQWLDSNSWALLLEVARSVPRLLVLVTSRTTAEPKAEFERLAELEPERIELTGLSPDEVGVLIGRRLGVDKPPPRRLVDFVALATRNPFFCERLVERMLDDGVLRDRTRARRWSATSPRSPSRTRSRAWRSAAPTGSRRPSTCA